MSARFSSSPALRLRIADSRIRRCLHLSLHFAALSALTLTLWQDGSRLAICLLPAVLLSGWQSRRDPQEGVLLCWRDGQWSLDSGDGERAVEVLPGSVCMPWLVCLPWRDMTDGRVGRLWLFADSVEAGGQRRLRLRLTLER